MEKTAPKVRNRRPASGFTLLEVLVASGILSFATLGLVQAVSSGQSQTLDALRRARATALADAMLEEVLSKPDDDPEGATGFGPDTGEITRAAFDNRDDYHGYTQAAGELTDAAGTAYPTPYQRFQIDTAVVAETVDIAALGGEQAGLRITVTVTEKGTTPGLDGGRSWTVTRFVPESE